MICYEFQFPLSFIPLCFVWFPLGLVTSKVLQKSTSTYGSTGLCTRSLLLPKGTCYMPEPTVWFDVMPHNTLTKTKQSNPQGAHKLLQSCTAFPLLCHSTSFSSHRRRCLGQCSILLPHNLSKNFHYTTEAIISISEKEKRKLKLSESGHITLQ